MRLHDLRHNAATFALATGATAREVADLLGHADGGALALKRYGHVLDERRHRNAAALDAAFGTPLLPNGSTEPAHTATSTCLKGR